MNNIALLSFLVILRLRIIRCDGVDFDDDETGKLSYGDELPKNVSAPNEFGYILEFTKQLNNHTESTGNNFKLVCEVTLTKSDGYGNFTFSNTAFVVSPNKTSNLIKKIKIKWLKSEAPIETDNNRISIRRHVSIKNSSVSSTVNIRNLEIHDKAFYSCIASIDKKQIESVALLMVRDSLIEDNRPTPLEPTYPKAEHVPDTTIPSGITEIFSGTNIELSFTKKEFSPSMGTDEDESEDPVAKIVTTKIYPKFNQKVPAEPLQGLCQLYTGANCATFLENQYVYIPYPDTQTDLEDKLTNAFKVIKYSNEISSTCEGYALPSLCFSTFPICRTPEETNKMFFKRFYKGSKLRNNIQKSSHKNISEDAEDEENVVHFENLPASGLPAHLDPNMDPPRRQPPLSLATIDRLRHNSRSRRKRGFESYDVEFHINTKTKKVFSEPMYPKFDRHTQEAQPGLGEFNIFRSSIPLRRVCREDCEILENELCQQEYAIAKRHPEIGKKLTLEECINLPIDSPDCLDIGIEKHVSSDEKCFWETGIHYRGSVNTSITGLPCIKWSHQIIQKLANHRELSGSHNHCRNPGGKESQPWCFVETGTKNEKQICDVPNCSHKLWIYIISSMIGICLLFTMTMTLVCCRHRNAKNNTAAIRNINLPNADKNIYGNSRLNSPIELTDLLSGQSGLGKSSSSRTNGILNLPQYTLSQIKFVEELGEGAFGKVYKGELIRDNETIFVAVKALKENASPKTQLDFRREIELISELRHENVVCILGVVLREEPLCMLFEFMAKGDLHEFLMERALPEGSGLSPVQFLSISRHIAAGMEYLAAHHYVHRDLAARNCLVADNLVVKISDFGLSRDIYSSDYYRVQSKSLLPVRWMPPESILYGKFTTESDVWSYGVVLWEIYSYGLQPYYGYSNQEVISMVRGRELLQCPSACPRIVYGLMRECWHQTPARRPNFSIITNRLAGWMHPSGAAHCDTTSDSSGAASSHRALPSIGDPRERMPLIGHHSSSNGSLAGSMPRKLSAAGSVRSHASTRLMMSSSDVTSGSDNCEPNIRTKKASCGSLLESQSSAGDRMRETRDTVVKINTMSQPYDI